MFFNTESSENKTFEKTRFLTMDIGQHIFRMLGTPKKMYSHFLRGKSLTVRCLEEGCPICDANAKIRTERPEDYFTNPLYFSKSERHYINVLDRTPVKVCPQCQTENKADLSKKFSPTCKSCEAFLTSVPVTVSDKVKVLNLSKTLAEQVNGYNQSVLDADGDPVGVENFDLSLMVVKSGDRKSPVISPLPENSDIVEVPEEMYYDLDKAIITLTADEIVNLMRGVSLKDIFVARRSSGDALEESVKASNDDIQEKIKTLFG